MTFYTITPVSNFIDNPRIQEFHACMFHGLAERDGKEFPHDTHVYAWSNSPSPLSIMRTVHGVPEICQPSSHLIVGERYAQQLDCLPHVRVMPVVFKRLVDVHYEKGDMSWHDNWGGIDPRHLLRTLPDIPEFHERIARYYEVQTYRCRDIVHKYPEAKDITIICGTPPMEEKDVVTLSYNMLQDYPILCDSENIVSEKVFETIRSDLDLDFFIVRQYSLTR